MPSEELTTIKSMAGCRGFTRDRRAYFRKLHVVELQETFFYPPRSATLRQWRQSAGEAFVFCVRAWQLVTHASPPGGTYPRLPRGLSVSATDCGMFQPTEAVQQAFERTMAAARTLQAPVVVFETPAAFTPTASNRGRLAAFFEKANRDGRSFVWDPQGVWEAEEVGRICQDLDLIAALDPLTSIGSKPTDGLNYFRLGKSRYTEEELMVLADAGAHSPAVFIFNSINMFKDAARLQSWLGGDI